MAALMLSPIFVLAIGESRYGSVAFGQIGGPNAAPGAPLAAPPPPPGQPQALSTVGALPRLNPAPGTQFLASPSAQATPQVFRCTCNGPGYPTAWMGEVSSTSYVLAQQSASSACTSYNLNANAQSPYIPPRPFGFTQAAPQPPGGLYSSPPGQVAGSVGPTALRNSSLGAIQQAQVIQQCQRCACN